jgi:transposase-like protein
LINFIGSLHKLVKRFSILHLELFLRQNQRLHYRDILVSHKAARSWRFKLGVHFKTVLKKRESPRQDKWPIDEQQRHVKREPYILWRAVI